MVPIENGDGNGDRDGRGDDEEGSDGSIVIAAVLVAISLVMASFAVTNAMDRNGVLLASSLAKTDIAIKHALHKRPRGASLSPVKQYTLATQGSPSRGSSSAKLTLVQFSDFQCSLCARLTPALRKLEREYGDDVRVVFKHSPMENHPKAPGAHAAAEAAHRQGKFWPMHDKIFANQLGLNEENYQKWAGEFGLDVAQFAKDRNAAEIKGKIASDTAEGKEIGLEVVPLFLLDGYALEKIKSYEDLEAAIMQRLVE